MSSILALDLGTVTGWAEREEFLKSSDAVFSVCSGIQNNKITKSAHNGLTYYSFYNWLNQWCSNTDVNYLYYEEVMRHMGAHAAHMYGGYLAITQMICAKKNIVCVGVGVKTIKKWITGNGNAKKQDVINSVNEKSKGNFGIITDNNQADALALLGYACAQKGKLIW